ncbi:MAG: heparinase II/III family protein [Clostridia bacterium]|nr:heparinase II/III family protein [Clostridia bacterium]
MFEPKLFTTPEEIQSIKCHLQKHTWYQKSFENIKEKADLLIKKGFTVPDESGYVFYESCKSDNTSLIFDPYNPHDHICPVCLMNYQDKPFHRAWVTQYHAWLSQMSILLGITYQIEKDEKYADALRKMLLDYSSRYQHYPNDDNELGPTRVFQSTYMESVWIMYLAGAYDMVRESTLFSLSDRDTIESDLFKASADIICDYDEGRNNRQAFNNSGILAVGYLIGDKKLVDYALHGKNGLYSHMNRSVFDDGFWYEGDNYHFATLPSIVNMAEMCLRNGLDLYHSDFNSHTIKMMFLAPLKSLQPDLTFPSRKDSVYESHMAQRWYAGLYELAYARYESDEFQKVLKTMFSFKNDQAVSTHNASGIMDVFKSQFSSREQLDWRGFLNAVPDLGNATGLPYTESVNMSGTGLAVLRNKRGAYASLDYGNYGGGHGHPDRLNLNFFTINKRWFSDFGTGNYYFDHLRWYRSTIGHNTITVDGQNHMVKDGSLCFFDQNEDFSIAKGAVSDIAPGVNMKRTLLLLEDDILVDLFVVISSQPHVYHYALHGFGELSYDSISMTSASLTCDHYDFIKNLTMGKTDHTISALFKDHDDELTVTTIGHPSTVVYKGSAYGPPNRIPMLFPVLIYERNEESTCFISLLKSQSAIAVTDFRETGDNEYAITLSNHKSYFIKNEKESLAIKVQSNQQERNYLFKDDKADKKSENLFEVEESLVYGNESSLHIIIRNLSDDVIEPFVSLIDTTVAIDPHSEKDIIFPLSKPDDYVIEDKLSVSFTVSYKHMKIERMFQKAYAESVSIPQTFPIDFDSISPSIILDRETQIRRSEKHWSRVQCLSSTVKVCHTEHSLYLQIKVTDDCVLQSGGKFPFDNDSVQLYFDQRKVRIDRMTSGTYGLLVVPGVNDNSSTVLSIDNTVKNMEKIGVSTAKTADGYVMMLSIPFECIGQNPAGDTLLGFDMIINDRDSGVRRDRQMIWSGCTPGERTYLKQDTHSPLRFGLLRIRKV